MAPPFVLLLDLSPHNPAKRAGFFKKDFFSDAFCMGKLGAERQKFPALFFLSFRPNLRSPPARYGKRRCVVGGIIQKTTTFSFPPPPRIVQKFLPIPASSPRILILEKLRRKRKENKSVEKGGGERGEKMPFLSDGSRQIKAPPLSSGLLPPLSFFLFSFISCHERGRWRVPREKSEGWMQSAESSDKKNQLRPKFWKEIPLGVEPCWLMLEKNQAFLLVFVEFLPFFLSLRPFFVLSFAPFPSHGRGEKKVNSIMQRFPRPTFFHNRPTVALLQGEKPFLSLFF